MSMKRTLINKIALIIAAALLLGCILSACNLNGLTNIDASPDNSGSDSPVETEEPESDYDPGKVLPAGAVYLPCTEHKTYGMKIEPIYGGDTVPCNSNTGEVRFFNGDMYKYEDYVYTYHSKEMVPNRGEGWSVGLNSDADRDREEYGPMFDSICGAPVYRMQSTFAITTNLKVSPKLPKYLTEIYDAFQNCRKLEAMPDIPDSVRIMRSVFTGCSSLKTLTALPKSLKRLDNTFNDCTSIVSLPEMPEGLEEMNESFKGCTALTLAEKIPDSVTTMRGAFKDCTALENPPVLPSSLENMAEIFSGCTSLRTAPVIPDGVTYMPDAFRGSAITEAPVLPSGVKNITGAFASTKIVLPPAIPAGVESLSGSFMNCTELTKAPVIPGSVDDIDYAFFGCTSLTEVPAFQEGVRDLDNAFAGCTSLKTLPAIPESVSSIRSFCMGCVNLTGVIEFNSAYFLDNECTDAFKGTVSPLFITGPYPEQLGNLIPQGQDNVQILE